ncbi:STAS domain-containing protein [Kineococcus glutinatus]|uniref:STAS domain-containing protein n=1 Tax=Kineococcus glutinatus TaxID=1070872 RepID=A0ABP9HSK7_9ACTN
MSLEVRQAPPAGADDRVEVLRARGDLDVTVVPAVLPRVPDLVAGTTGVVLDLSEVTFCDSSGIRLVNSFAAACARARVGFRVVAPPGSSGRRILDLVEMAEGLAVDSLPEALDGVRGAVGG